MRFERGLDLSRLQFFYYVLDEWVQKLRHGEICLFVSINTNEAHAT